MSRQITKKQKDWVNEYLKSGNKTQAALKTYNTMDYKTASVIGSDNFEKPRVVEFMQSVAQEMADHMHHLAKKAKSENVQALATKDLLDRAGYKPTDKMQITGNFTLESVFKKSKEDIKNLEVKQLE